MVGKASFWYKILHQFWAFWKAERNLLKYMAIYVQEMLCGYVQLPFVL